MPLLNQAQAVSCADVMVSKMDSCMVDLVDFHKRQASGQPEQSDNDAESMHSSVTHQGELPEPSQEVDSREGIPNADKVTFESETDVPVAPPAAMHRQSSQGFDFRRRKQQETGGGGILAAFRRSLRYFFMRFPCTSCDQCIEPEGFWEISDCSH